VSVPSLCRNCHNRSPKRGRRANDPPAILLGDACGSLASPRDGDSPLLLYRAAEERLYAQKLIRSWLSEAEVVALPSQAERLMLRARRPA
jgi:hypothetical protein